MKFDYRACDREGRARRGVLEADSLRQARDRLREKGWQVLAVQARRRSALAGLLAGRWMGGVSSGDLALLTRQLATLLSAALPLEEALMAVARQTEKKGLQAALTQVRQRILEGFPLAQALGQYPQIFDRLYCAMVAAGEIAGHLGPVLERLADYVEQRQHMKNKIVQALVYPMVLTAVAIGVVAILLTAVVPKVIEQFVHMKQTLPLSTRMLLGASDGLRQWGGGGVDGGAGGTWRFPLSPAGSGAARTLACVHPAAAGGRQTVAGGEYRALRQNAEHFERQRRAVAGGDAHQRRRVG